jgi:uncharacterized membrane protein YkvI
MYNYIFWVVHYNSYFKESDKWISRFKATLVLCFSFLMHLFLLAAICKRYFIPSLTLGYPADRMFIITILAVMVGAVYRHYSYERIEALDKRFSDRRWHQLFDVIVVILSILVPLIGIIWLSSRPS